MILNNTQENKRKDIQGQIEKSISLMNDTQQKKLLDFINSMILEKEHPPKNLLKHVGKIDADELEMMKKAIKDCEKIDFNEW